MTKVSFYIALSTSAVFSADEYEREAGNMLNLLTSVFSDAEQLAVITKDASLLQCHTNIEVSQSDNGLVGKAVIDLECEGKVTLDKAKLSQILKKDVSWPDVKLEKRLVPLEQPGDLVPEGTASMT